MRTQWVICLVLTGAGFAQTPQSTAAPAAAAAASQSASPSASQSPSPSPSPSPWKLVWNDEFNGGNGSAPEKAKWILETGGNGWGNNELEFYTNRVNNVQVQDGKLIITARKEGYSDPNGKLFSYTSARIKTQGKFAQRYGRFEARIQIPRGQGLWPAFWMLGDDIVKVSWPDCGEIDIMENVGKEPDTVHGTIHGPGYSGDKGPSALYKLADGKAFADDYHLYAVEWEPQVIRFYVDDTLYATRTPADLPPGARWVYDHPFFVILNVAVGGNWPGDPDVHTKFPQTMLVDYVRVYER
jgi:beta-glucanase (GH16 family)